MMMRKMCLLYEKEGRRALYCKQVKALDWAISRARRSGGGGGGGRREYKSAPAAALNYNAATGSAADAGAAAAALHSLACATGVFS